MHPLLGNWRRLAWYLAAWIPVAGLLAVLLAASAQLSRLHAVELAVPMALAMAVDGMFTWYICRAFPLEINLERALTAFGSAAVVVGGVYALLASWWVQVAGWSADRHALIAVMWGAAGGLYLLEGAGHYLVLSSQKIGEAERRSLLVSAMANKAELRALKAQINPHFLFNSLNSISALTASNPMQARDMTIRLGDFLRRTLALGTLAEHSTVALEQELELVRAFLAIEQVRYGERLRLEESVEPRALEAQLPPLLLQPLIENAVVHGIAHLTAGGVIRMEARCADQMCRLEVANPYDHEAPRLSRSGLGLANVQQRLHAHFGVRGRCEVARGEGTFQVVVTVPMEQIA